ncbi:flavin reductase family protein [Saccharothrix algeriensis]|uniref:Flavin reductase (DIM6/NTAB) family NADH-FMN oxidoreductase RutF n=1 Tax=Saccharothrix algeriensis TaxID=173560 RepID=A0ABS2SHY4_9PSEU|nr:flavin reductase family protein [Saccharothrix algeriensis]MBM7814913.1 flavin reductase (DIM6/NTAB) family NADH-FMN oxidoreductase RutF [Saccharothrix algeriensis]
MTGSTTGGLLDAGDVDPTRLRRAMSRFASGVTVVTTAVDGPDGPEAHGMTANAFLSVSLSPPLVLVSVAAGARSHRRIADTGRYGVSVLRAEQQALSRHFAGVEAAPEQVRFDWRDGLPLIDGALVQLACTVRASHPAGDHVLHVASVDRLWADDGAPLLLYNGRPRTLRPAPEERPAPGTTGLSQ